MRRLFHHLHQVTSVGVAFLILFNTVQVAALSAADLKAIRNNTVWYKQDPTLPGAGADCGVAATAAADGSVDRFLQVLSFQESGGNPKAENKSGSASGKYQYIDGTWKSSAKNYYPPALQFGGHASNAPESVQDAVAYLEYTKKFKDLNGDLFKLAVSHYLPAALSNTALLDKVPAGGNTKTPRAYADGLIANISKGVGSKITMNYSQAPDFATWLAKVGGEAAAATAASTPTAANCTVVGGIPADSFVFYDQYDKKWASRAYGTSTIADSGCGPSSVAMIVATLSDKTVTPVEVADFGTSIGAYIPNKGSDHQKMLQQGPQHWGLTSTPLGTDISKAIEAIKGGALVIATGTGGVRPYTTSGHIIVLRAVTADGKIQVGDPGFTADNNVNFDPSAITAGLTSLWAVTK